MYIVETFPDITFQYRKDLNVLIVRWMNDSTTQAITARYEHILDLAITYQCRCWHIDLRRRNAQNRHISDWFVQSYVQRVTAAFPQGIRVGYLLSQIRMSETGMSDTQLHYNHLLHAHALQAFDTEEPLIKWLQA